MRAHQLRGRGTEHNWIMIWGCNTWFLYIYSTLLRKIGASEYGVEPNVGRLESG